MSLTVVLAVGLDSWLLSTQSAAWRSEGFVVITAGTVQEAIDHFKTGDFDLVLLGDSVSRESRETLSFLIRASGAQTPVVSVSEVCSDSGAMAGATQKNYTDALLNGISELIAARGRPEAAAAAHLSTAR